MERKLSLGQRFGFLGRSFKRQLDEMLREEDLTGVQFHVLSALVRLEDAGETEISQRELEQSTHLAHPTMTEIVRRLEKKDYLRTRPSERDRRCKCIASTEKARRLRQRALEVDEATARWLCRGLTEEQQEALTSITDLMIQNVSNDCKEGCGRAHD